MSSASSVNKTTRPIIFSGSMVERLLAGWKRQTRRLATSPLARCQPGDVLWVRETIARYQTVNSVLRSGGRSFDEVSDGLAGYRADGFDTIDDFKRYVRSVTGHDYVAIEVMGDKWIPSIHMPRWASRLTLVVTDVRRQRLQDITPDDAKAEGDHERSGHLEYYERGPLCHVDWFRGVWESLHGFGSWNANPEIVALTFEVQHRNVDARRPATATQLNQEKS